MTVDIIQHASIAGELARNLWGRTDFEKFDSAWAQAHNWTVDYRGGLFTRAGFEFGDYISWAPGEAIKFIEFQFAPDTANTYLCVFTDLRIRFVQDNAYVLEESKVVTGVVADMALGNQLRLTVTAHGYANGDWVKLSGFTQATLLKLNGRSVIVSDKTNNTFRVIDPGTGLNITSTSAVTGTGQANRVYSIPSPYGEEELARLQAVQIRDHVRLTHPNHPIKNLIRNDATDWEVKDEVIGRTIGVSASLSATAWSHTEGDTFVYHVTAVSIDGEEGLSRITITPNGPEHTTKPNRYLTVSWARVPGALYYNVYRSRVVSTNTGENIFSDMTVGYIGQSVGTSFTDPGITPDFQKQPPLENNPFANGRIEFVTVTAGGSGYVFSSVITWPAGGTGAYGFLVTEGRPSPVRGLRVLSGGKNYTSDVITASVGSGAVMTATRSAAFGNNPHCCALFQQRMVYGATDQHPLRIFGSKPGFLSNFDVGFISSDEDAYEFDLDTDKVSPIRHMLPVRGGLLAFNQIGVWLVSGRSNAILNPNNAQAELQNATGSGYVRPTYVDSYVIYATGSGQEIRMLAYDDYAKVFGDNNVSLLSNHLFSPNLDITSLTYCAVPYKVIYATQANGRLLSLTIDNANSVYGCTPNWTRGYFRECLSISEEGTSRLYVAVERNVGGKKVMFFERQHGRNFAQLEDACCADACLKLTPTFPAASMQPSSLDGPVTFTILEGTLAFNNNSIGQIVRCGAGKAIIESRMTGNAGIGFGRWLRPLAKASPESPPLPIFEAGEWTLDPEVTTIGGLWHLEGKAVSCLADGEVVGGLTVLNGQVTLPVAASRVVVGLGYSCIGQSLPLTTNDTPIEGRRKDIVGVALRLHETAGLKYGSSLEKLYDLADRGRRLGWHSDPYLRDGVVYEISIGDWKYDAQVYFVQNDPLPASILSFIRDIDVGDDKGGE